MRLVWIVCCTPLAVWAGEPAGSPASDDIVVTAARIPVALSTASSGTTVITREEIERRNPQYLTDLLRDVPGFTVSRNGGAGAQTQVRVRGAEGNHLLVLIDGIEANDFSQNDEFDFAHLLASDIERVEIVRGPQSALWGSDALAGVINIITRGGRRRRGVDGSFEYGSFDTKSGVLGADAATSSVRARLGASYVDTGGINVSRHGAEDDGYRNGTLNLKLGWQPLDNVGLDLTGRATDGRTEFDTPDYATDGLNHDVPATTDIVQAYVGGRVHVDTFDGRWLHTLSGAWTKLGNVTYDPSDPGKRRTEGRKYALHYQSTWRANTSWVGCEFAHSATAAIEYELEEFKQRGPIVFGADPNQDRRRHTIGYVAEYRVEIAAATSLGVGGRWDDNSGFDDIGTYRVTLNHRVVRTGTTFSAAYGTGSKAPTFTERYGYFANGGLPFIGNSSLSPEQSHGYELGLRQQWSALGLMLGLTYFNEHLTDEIDGFVFDPVRGAFTAVNRPGTSKRRGAEVTGRLDLTPSLGWTLAYTYLDATEQPGSRRTDEVRRPHNQVATSLFWRAPDRRLSLDLHLTYSTARDDFTFLPPTYSGRTELAPYTLLGLSAAYALSPRVTLTGRLENMLDEQYEEVFDFQTEGVAAYIGIKFDFEP